MCFISLHYVHLGQKWLQKELKVIFLAKKTAKKNPFLVYQVQQCVKWFMNVPLHLFFPFRLMSSLKNERIRSKQAGDRDSDTIIDLRTALEVERELRVEQANMAASSPLLNRRPDGIRPLFSSLSLGSIPVNKQRFCEDRFSSSLAEHEESVELMDVVDQRETSSHIEKLERELREETGPCECFKRLPRTGERSKAKLGSWACENQKEDIWTVLLLSPSTGTSFESQKDVIVSQSHLKQFKVKNCPKFFEFFRPSLATFWH